MIEISAPGAVAPLASTPTVTPPESVLLKGGVPGAALPTPASAPDAPKVMSMAALKARIEARNTPDKARLQTFYHEGLEGFFFVGAMSSPGYLAVENPHQFAPPGSPLAGQLISSPSTDALNRDLAYLMNGAWLEDENGLGQMEREAALSLYNGKGNGPSNRALINAIKALNPPREHLNREVATMYAMDSATACVWRVLFQVGLGRALLDYIAPSATPEEKAWAARQIAKAEEVFIDFEPYFRTNDNAATWGFELRPQSVPDPL